MCCRRGDARALDVVGGEGSLCGLQGDGLHCCLRLRLAVKGDSGGDVNSVLEQMPVQGGGDNQ